MQRLIRFLESRAGWRALVVAFGLGALAALAMPPLYALPVLLVALPGLLVLLGEAKGWKRAALIGWAFGWGHQVVGLYWITYSIPTEAERLWWLVPLAVPLLALWMGLYTAIAAVLAWRAPPGWPRVLVLAGGWVVAEFVRGWAFTGFPWNLLGTVWAFAALPIQAASLIGVHGLSLVTVLLAFPVAYYVSFMVRPEKKATWLFLITIPFWTSYLIRVFLWKVILGYNGVINSGLTGLGIIDEPLTFILYNVNSIVITLAHAYAPFAILPIFVALEKIDRSLLEAGRDLGESRAMTFWRVTLPLAMPGVLAAVLIVFIPTIGDYVTPELIGGGKIPMIANLIQVQMLALDNRPLGSALAVTAMAIVALVSIVFLLINRRFLKVRS